MNRRRDLAFGAGLVAAIILARVLPHPANFTPMIAAGMFAGVYFRDKVFAIFVPAIGLILSDVFLAGNSFVGNLIVVAAATLSGILGALISKNFAKKSGPKKFVRVFGATLAASVAFFLITNCNFLYNGYGMYPQNFAGLAESYAAGLPFFRTQILGDAIYTGAFFGLMEFSLAKSRQKSSVRAEN